MTEFVAIIAELFEDPAEKQTAMSKLDTLKQGGKSLIEFITEFDLLAQVAGYKLPDHNEFSSGSWITIWYPGFGHIP